MAEEGSAEVIDVVGWKEIADLLRISMRTAQRWAGRPDDPLPIEHHEILGICARKARLQAWDARRLKSYTDHLAEVRARDAA